MAQSSAVKILETIHVSPPPNSVPTTSLPLVYFDMPWFHCRPIQRLFFYEFPHPTSHFMETVLPILKRSLSLTLQRFFPYAANIICPQPPGKPYIKFMEGDFVNFTVAESDADFNHVIANYPRPIELLHPFVPQLPPARVTEDGIRALPIIAFRVTVFPNSGLCIGSTYFHVVGDGKSFMHFMKSWASVCRSGGDLTCLKNSLPLINRDVIKDPRGYESGLLKLYWQWISSNNENSSPTNDVAADKVRATFVMDRGHAERLKHFVTAQCSNGVDSEQLHISTFVVTCAIIWVCLIKSKESAANNGDEFNYFIISFDCRNRLEFPVPPTYFGNCLSGCAVDVRKSDLVGENGIVLAAKAIGSKIKEMERNSLEMLGEGMSGIVEKVSSGRGTPTAGSPKLQVYDTDFGWGRPRKVELTHVDYDGAISLADCRDGQGGIEVSLALDKNQMDTFVTIFQQSLRTL